VCAVRARLPGDALEEAVDGLEQGVLLMRGKPLDLLQAAQNAQAGLAAQGSLRSAGLEQFVGRDLERSGKPDDHGGVHAQTVALIVGDERLNNPKPFSQFDLGPAAFLAQPRQPLADGLRCLRLRRLVGVGPPRCGSTRAGETRS